MNWTAPVVALLLWAIPLAHPAIGGKLTGHDFARLAQLALLVLSGFWWVSRTPVRAWAPTRGPGRSPVALGLCLVLALLSALLAPVPWVALSELLLVAGLCTFSLALREALRDRETFDQVLHALTAGAFAYAALVTVLLGLSLFVGEHYQPWEALVGFDNPRFLNHVQTLALPLVAIVAARPGSGLWRALAWLTLLFSGVLLFITFGRATLLALTLGWLTMLIAFGRRGWPYARAALVPTLLGMLLTWLAYQQWMQASGFVIDTEQLARTHYRGFLAMEALKLWWTSPWLGVGPMHFSHWFNDEAAHPHNVYVQVLCEYGVLAAVLIFFAAARWLFHVTTTLRRVSDARVPVAAGLWVATIGVFVDGGFSGNFVMPMSQLWIALVFALVSAFLAEGRGGSEWHSMGLSAAGRRPRRFAWLARWTIVAGLGWLAVTSYSAASRSDNPALPTAGPVGAPSATERAPNPRFWTIGWF